MNMVNSMAIKEFNINGKIIRVNDDVDEKETGINIYHIDNEEEIKDESHDDEKTLVDIFGDKDEK